jgi:hypothetical protein
MVDELANTTTQPFKNVTPAQVYFATIDNEAFKIYGGVLEVVPKRY